MTLAVTAIIVVGAALFLLGRVTERKNGESKRTNSMRIIGLALVFYGALKIVFGI